MVIKLYGKLEKIALETMPSRSDVCFALCTLAQKHSPQELLNFITNETSWQLYDGDAEKLVNWSTKKISPNNQEFFSPLKEPLSVKIWKFNKGYVRSCYDNEVSLDIDSKEQFDLGVRFFKLVGFYGNCRTWKGARGGHISLFFESPVTNEFRKQCRFVFGGDPHSINISVEGKPHHRTGNLVYLIAENLLEK